MQTLHRFAHKAVTALALLCLLSSFTSCQRTSVRRSPLLSSQRQGRDPAAVRAQELREARQRVDEQSRALHAKGLGSAGAPGMAVSVARETAKSDPQYAPAYDLLGWGLLEEAGFDEAAAAFRRSLELAPNNLREQKGLREALRLAEVARSLPLLLKPGQRLLALVEVRRGPQASIFALTGAWEEWERGDWYVRRPEVRFFVSHQGRYRETFQTAAVAWGGRDEIGYYRAWAADLLTMGRQQIVLVSGQTGADHFSEALDVFLPGGRFLRHIVHVTGVVTGGDSPFEVKDLNGDRRPEIKVWNMLEFLHANGVYWCDVFQYDGYRYRLATRRFPNVVRKNVAELESWHEFCRQEGTAEGEQVRKHLALGRRYLAGIEKASPARKRS